LKTAWVGNSKVVVVVAAVSVAEDDDWMMRSLWWLGHTIDSVMNQREKSPSSTQSLPPRHTVCAGAVANDDDDDRYARLSRF